MTEAELLTELLRQIHTPPPLPLEPGPRVRCNHCGDVIQSQHRHDFVECGCGKIAVDGGGDYLRLVAPTPESYTVLPDETPAAARAEE